jgi:hypothetical protein
LRWSPQPPARPVWAHCRELVLVHLLCVLGACVKWIDWDSIFIMLKDMVKIG